MSIAIYDLVETSNFAKAHDKTSLRCAAFVCYWWFSLLGVLSKIKKKSRTSATTLKFVSPAIDQTFRLL